MSTGLLNAWPAWRNALVAQLRSRDLPDEQIDDILLEVEEHLRDTGETPQEAFGEPPAYVDALVGKAPGMTSRIDPDFLQPVVITLVTVFGIVLLASGAQGLGQGTDAVGTLDSWFALPAGALVLLAAVWWLPPGELRNPRSGRPLLGHSVTRLRVVAIALIAITAIAFYLFGRALA